MHEILLALLIWGLGLVWTCFYLMDWVRRIGRVYSWMFWPLIVGAITWSLLWTVLMLLLQLLTALLVPLLRVLGGP